VGSLFYYSALGRIDASLGQLLYTLYPLFLVLWLSLDRQLPSKITVLRLALALPAIFLLSQTGTHSVDWVGILQMLIAAALYALHLPINQHVLYDMPAPTVTLYTLIAMSMVVVPVYLISGGTTIPPISSAGIPLVGLTLVTFFSRLTLFMGVKHIGGMQTAILGLGELLVTVFFAHLWLNERLSYLQWLGAGLLLICLALVALDQNRVPENTKGGWLNWLRPTALNKISLRENKGDR
jgi:drug/metabolite transporter (DMT)-like permease